LPAMISALEVFSVEASAMQRHATMRTGIVQSEGLSLAVLADHQRDFEQHSFVQLIAMYSIGRQRTIPEAAEHKRVWCLALRGIEVGHG
jgi:hypothetical protein